MTLDDFPTLKATLSPRRANIIADLLPALEQARADGEIANPRFLEAKDQFGRAFEESWRAVEDRMTTSVYSRRRAGEDVPKKIEDFFIAFMYPQAHLMAGQIKKLEAMPADDISVAKLLPYLKELWPLADLILTLKTMAVKRVTKTDDEKREERYRPPSSSSKAVAKVTELLEGVVNSQFEDLVASITTRHMRTLNSFVKALAAADADPSLNGMDKWNRRANEYYSLGYHFTYQEGQFKGKMDSVSYGLLRNVVKPGVRPTGNRGEIVSPNAPEMMAAEARKQAEDIRKTFVVKNLRKIVSILEGKGDDQFDTATTVSQSVDLHSLEGSFLFTFKDGSSFYANNSVVWKVSSLGTPFNQFPLRFHNVKLPGGVTMKMPSEQNMNTTFLGKTA